MEAVVGLREAETRGQSAQKMFNGLTRREIEERKLYLYRGKQFKLF